MQKKVSASQAEEERERERKRERKGVGRRQRASKVQKKLFCLGLFFSLYSTVLEPEIKQQRGPINLRERDRSHGKKREVVR
jgi:hypothetical protein